MPVGQHAVHLLVRVRRYECMACARSWTDDLTHMADEGRRLTDAAVWWAVAEVVLKSKSVLACARDLHCSCVLLQCLFDRFGSVFPQCGLMVFPGVVIVSR